MNVRMQPKFRFGQTSLNRLGTCAMRLQRVAHGAMALQLMDFTVLQGHRGEIEQTIAFNRGASEVRWPDSKHNAEPSLAFDIAPYPVRWGRKGDPERVKAIGNFYRLAGIVLAVSKEVGIDLRWGGDWDCDSDIYDNAFDDLVHFELLT